MPTDPLTGARYPASTNVPNVPQDIQNAVNDLSGAVGGSYATTTARDAAFAAWVSAGHTMSDGLRCTVAGVTQVYRGGSWRIFSSALPSAYTGNIFTAGTPPLKAYRDQNDMITLSGQINTAVTFNQFLGSWLTLPTGFRPSGIVFGLAYLQSGGVLAYQVGTDGVVAGVGYPVGGYPIPSGYYLAFNHIFPGA